MCITDADVVAASALFRAVCLLSTGLGHRCCGSTRDNSCTAGIPVCGDVGQYSFTFFFHLIFGFPLQRPFRCFEEPASASNVQVSASPVLCVCVCVPGCMSPSADTSLWVSLWACQGWLGTGTVASALAAGNLQGHQPAYGADSDTAGRGGNGV